MIDQGDRFELRHKFEPAVLTGRISQSGSGSVVSVRIEGPAQSLYRLVVGFVVFIAVFVLGASAYGLAFGTHLLVTRSRTELGPEHLATRGQHIAVFVLVPLVAISIIATLWPKARGLKAETRRTFLEFLQKLFEAEGI